MPLAIGRGRAGCSDMVDVVGILMDKVSIHFLRDIIRDSQRFWIVEGLGDKVRLRFLKVWMLVLAILRQEVVVYQ